MQRTTAIYARVSTHAQGIESQLPDLGRWCTAMGLPTLPEAVGLPIGSAWKPEGGSCWWYLDQYSGRRMEAPGLRLLIADMQARLLGKIVVWRIDRLGRNARGLCQFIEDCRALGTSLVSLRDSFDLDTPGGRMQAQILASVAEFETEVRAERCAAGIAAARELEAKIKALHAGGKEPMEISRIVKLDVERVRRAIRSRNGSLSWGGDHGLKRARKRDATDARMLELLRMGHTPRETARFMGISYSTFNRRVMKLGGLRGLGLARKGGPKKKGEPEVLPIGDGLADENDQGVGGAENQEPGSDTSAAQASAEPVGDTTT